MSGRNMPRTLLSRGSWSKLTNVTLYWVTQTITSSVRLYRETRTSGQTPEYVAVPTGVARFPKEVLRFPRAWVERRYNVTHWTDKTELYMEYPPLVAG